ARSPVPVISTLSTPNSAEDTDAPSGGGVSIRAVPPRPGTGEGASGRLVRLETSPSPALLDGRGAWTPPAPGEQAVRTTRQNNPGTTSSACSANAGSCSAR